ncbi:iron transport multicopper oxidase fet3 [Grosmannia clavigera kw1407]|uniref:Iron transport multicopper oxidase fet3 n=1 Tax=Grosmannia clavigera (strain kw1407 / UAMH 11150) TaxID=655863 RepID=F0XJW5_GROCL|nr:iron transport multicopper oxidase fet3 [Grosmannia clavigera kw1407]EFX02163.1 iron transport multicopper oxidase fet3 [Grosmannia clavigera kw1407]
MEGNTPSVALSEQAAPLLGVEQTEDVSYNGWQEEELQDGEPLVHKRARWRWSLYVPVLTILAALAVTSTLFVLITYSPVVLRVPEATSSAPATSDRAIKLVLHPEDHVSREAKATRLSWNITMARLAPDGVQRDVILVNGQFPGPTVEARSGDTLVIEVFNSIDESLTLHWHGLHMKGANHMDGPDGFNQCPIPPGGKFVYEIPTDSQSGTFWYHAHSELQRADGLYGGFIIHNPYKAEASTYQYDQELLFLIGDWYHFVGKEIFAVFKDPTSNGDEPCPSSFLINGRGYFDCSNVVPAAPVNCSETQMPSIVLDKKLRYRFRLINVGSLSGISTTVSDGTMKAIQIDGGLPVVSHEANSIGVLYPAQRVDFILSWPESAAQTDTELMITVDDEYYVLSMLDPPSRSVQISPASSTGRPSEEVPSYENSPSIVQFDLREAHGPVLTSSLPDPDNLYMIYSVVEILSHNKYIPKGYINHTSWIPQKKPLLSTVRSEWDNHQLVPWTGSKPVWVELTINNIDTQGHSFHLHGFDFYVIASYEGLGGWDYYNPFTPWTLPRGGPFNVVDPLQRDTIYVPPYGYAVLRFLADNEGIWLLHCHILWHAASGMTMAFQVLGDEIGLSQSSAGLAAKEYCEASSI